MGEVIETENGELIEVPEGYEYDCAIKPNTTEYTVTPFVDWLLKQ